MIDLARIQHLIEEGFDAIVAEEMASLARNLIDARSKVPVSVNSPQQARAMFLVGLKRAGEVRDLALDAAQAFISGG
jgi:hypothetical protein